MLTSRRQCAIIGLPAVGKSSLVAALHGRPGEAVPPTQGCNKSTLSRDSYTLDLLDLGGQPGVRKFWANLAQEADAIICVANASEADDLAWAMLGTEIRNLREGRPMLLVLNQRDVPERACASVEQALTRLELSAADPSVGVQMIASSADVAGAEVGIEWLCGVLAGVADGDGAMEEADDSNLGAPGGQAAEEQLHSWNEPAAEPLRPAAGASRLRVMRTLQDARQQAGAHEADMEELQQRLMNGHILTEHELELIRAADRSVR